MIIFALKLALGMAILVGALIWAAIIIIECITDNE